MIILYAHVLTLYVISEKLLSGSEVSKMELSMLLRFKRMPDLVQKWVCIITFSFGLNFATLVPILPSLWLIVFMLRPDLK